MGLFDSKSKSTKVTTTTTTSRNDNISDVEDSRIFSDVGRVNIQALDGATVDRSLKFGDDALRRTLDFGGDAIDRVGDSTARALEFGQSTLNENTSVLDRALDFGQDVLGGANEQLSNTLKSVTSAAGVNANIQSKNTTDAVKQVAVAAAVVASIWVIARFLK